MNYGIGYQQFYEVLLNLRELFHSYGRIDDANAKLDELIKIIFLSYYEAIKGKRLNLAFVKGYAKDSLDDSDSLAKALRAIFEEACKDDFFHNDDATCIFGASPSLSIQPSEDSFAEKLMLEIGKIDFVNLAYTNDLESFDIVNECFGHFVRENFRNNKEDAQYMTPAEITAPLLDMIFSDICEDGYLDSRDFDDFVIMDPTCGVGTLLIESARRYIRYVKEKSGDSPRTDVIIRRFLHKGVIGQDKVDRMVRLSKINALLFGGNSINISVGNSISDITAIDKYSGTVDLIFTNPPFGADYDASTLCKDNFADPFTELYQKKTLCSEILMLMKCLKLLRPGGYLAIVLPDSVFSSKGVYADVRAILSEYYDIRAIIELPAVTFAQAGTRTKTSICYLKKRIPTADAHIIMAVCENIGYNVRERMGVPVKLSTGQNDTVYISKTYIGLHNCNKKQILSNAPSVTAISRDALINGIMNASFYSATRLRTLQQLCSANIDGFRLCKLMDLVKFESLDRKSYMTDECTRHISVLHINPDCTIDFSAVEVFKPISRGRECREGDLLFSKINPRIPRITVVPQYSKKLVCSNEFEIMVPISNVDVYTICLLLRSTYVQRQIEDLTSGTSSSHSRIKREQLANVLIPCPESQTASEAIANAGRRIHAAFSDIYAADNVISNQTQWLETLTMVEH